MAPLLQVGDQVELTYCAADDLTAGDIIVLEENHSTLTHRFWHALEHAGDAYLLTRGDRVPTYDQPHEASALIGRIITRIRADTTLALDSGKGLRLNRHLGKIAAFENRIFAPTTACDDWQGLQSAENRRLGSKWNPFLRRLVRALIRSYSKLLVLLSTR